MHRFRSFLLALVLLVPAAVRAADVPVTYTVDTTALKLAVSGTNLTFQLYTDATCTALAHTQILTIDATNMQSVLKRSKPKNGVKPPKTTDIRAVLTGVGPAAPLYAQVTGTGITPVGGACQVQAATAPGAGGGATVVLKDANGALLGPIDVSSGVVVLSDSGVPVYMPSIPSTGFVSSNTFYYASANCSGPRLSQGVLVNHLQFGQVDGTDVYHGPGTAPSTTVNSFDQAPQTPLSCTGPGQVFIPPNRCCCTSPGCTPGFTGAFGPPSIMSVGGFVPPFSASIQ